MIEKLLETRHKKRTRRCLTVGFTECYRKLSSPSSRRAVVRPPNVEQLRYRMHVRSDWEETCVYDMSSAISDASQSLTWLGWASWPAVRIDDKYLASQPQHSFMTMSLAAASEARKARLLALRRKRAGEEVEDIEYIPVFFRELILTWCV
jgi:hypothetical protein